MYSSDMERSQTWQIQQQHQQQQQQPQHQQQYASAERQSQSGWFPLEDALLVSSQPQPQIVYAADEQLLAPQQQDSGRWVTQPAAVDHPYVHEVGRLSIPSRPDPVAAMYPQHPQAYTTSSSSQEIGMSATQSGAGTYAAWPQDSRLSASSESSVPGIIAVQFENQQYVDRPQQHPYVGVVHGGMTMARSQPQHMYQTSHPHPRSGRKAKEISIGRWNADEHKWFLKGLEMFQGPAWGEIARLIGTRTSTQVRTHAQKFFTKLARMNQTLPYFDAQIQKERARLLAQGALGGSTSVTPTSTSGGGFNYALSNLSPRKRVNGSGGSSPSGAVMASHLKRDPQESDYTTSATSSSSLYGSSNSGSAISLPSEYHPSQSRMAEYDDQVRSGGGGMAYYHHAAEDNNNSEMFKPKYDPSGGLSPLLRKPRMYIDASGHPVSSAVASTDPVAQGYDSLHHPHHPHHHHHQQQQQQHLGYASGLTKDEFNASRQQHFVALDASQLSHHQQQLSRGDDMSYGMLHTSAATADPWSGDDPAQRHWIALPPTSSSHADSMSSSNTGGLSLDAESLPSMNKLLYRGAAA